MTRRRLLLIAAACAVPVAGVALLAWPTSTRQGIDYQVTTYRIPAYVKVTDFFHRHYQYQLLVSRICAGTNSDAQRLLALLDWTHANIRATPDGWPIVDDHPLHILIRGYGEEDQMADAFTTLATYADIPSFFRFLLDPVSGRRLVLTFARIAGTWVVLDVEQRLVFRRKDGGMASVDELIGDPQLVDAQTQGGLGSGVRYSTFISAAQLRPFDVPEPLHGELQQPLARLRYEARRLIGLASE